MLSRLTEKFNRRTLSLLLISQVCSSLLWIGCYIHLSDQNCQRTSPLAFFSVIRNEGEVATATSRDDVRQDLLQVIYKLTSDVARAFRQTSYGSMKYELGAILRTLGNSLDAYNAGMAEWARNILQEREEFPKFSSSIPFDVCPEEYDGGRRDYPLFRYGWKSANCSYAKPLNQMLSLAIDFVGRSKHFISSRGSAMLERISRLHPGITVVVATEGPLPKKLEILDLNFLPVVMANKDTPEILRAMVHACRTPYIFIGHNLSHFDGRDEDFTRLIRQIGLTGVDIAAGSIRDKEGHWKMGCQQVTIKGFNMKYTPGYEFSQNSCVLCDSIDGPFVARTRWLKTVEFDSNLDVTAQIIDLHLNRLLAKNRPSWICPDVMFYVDVDLQDEMRSRDLMLPLAQKHEITAVHLADGTTLNFGSSEVLDGCQNSKRQTLQRPQCCLDNLNSAVKRVMKVCSKLKVICELSEGTVLGAIKFGESLPWEKDADIVAILGNVSVSQFGKALKAKDYRIQCHGGSEAMCLLHTKYWVVEIRSVEVLDSTELSRNSLARTKLFFKDQWLPSSRNPGLAMRNRYGHELYRHADHWTVTRHKDSWVPYTSGRFVRCKFPGHHACLDQFRADGNLHFTDGLKIDPRHTIASNNKDDGAKDDGRLELRKDSSSEFSRKKRKRKKGRKKKKEKKKKKRRKKDNHGYDSD